MSRLVPPDPARTVHLDGVGEVSRPVEVGRDASGLARLSMRAYDFLAGQVIDGEAEGDEVGIVLLRGRATIAVADGGEPRTWELAGRSSPFDGPPHAVYLPPRHRYRLTLHADATVSYARAAAGGGHPPRHIPPDPSRLRTSGGARIYSALAAAEAEHLLCDEIVVPAGSSCSQPAARRDEGGEVPETILHLHALDPAARLRVRVGAAGSERSHALAERDSLAFADAPFALDAPPGAAARVLRIAARGGRGRVPR